MTIMYNFPRQSAFGRSLPKTKIYEHSAPSKKVKELFIKNVEKITWSYKLSPATINLPASDGVHEIQVFTIPLKTGTLAHEVLQTIDKAIPSPILFVLTYEGKAKYVAAYKRPSEADKSKWVISSYFETEWIAGESHHTELPMVLNLGALYQTLLKNIIPLSCRDNETLDELVTRVERLQIREREIARVESLMKKEKQFNRKVQLNSELKHLKQKIEELKRSAIAGEIHTGV